jgi:hypothetical protein
VNRRRWHAAVARGLLLGWLVPAVAAAQSATSPTQPASGGPAASSTLWLVAGTTFVAVRGDCQTCEEDFPYRHAPSILADIGYRVNDRMDVGGEVFWVPVETDENNIRTTHLDAVAQFRPWASQGFFLKGGAGMAFIRNWVDGSGPGAINSKALSVIIGGGWAFRRAERVGFQMFGAQHFAALGDLQREEESVPDVVGNFWSLGAAIVIR